MTETRSTDNSTARQTMADVDHVHRYDPGASVRFYGRGPAAFTDGGERSNASRTSNDERSEREAGEPEHDGAEAEPAKGRPTMKDVDHTPPDESREVNRVFERGGESNGDGR